MQYLFLMNTPQLAARVRRRRFTLHSALNEGKAFIFVIQMP
jgi:hypothetical protein